MSKFTKGEWHVIGEIVIAEKGRKTIKPLCSLTGRIAPEEDEANAHLIATAPDMYKLLERYHEESRFVYGEDYDEVEDLLAKARGEIK